MILRRHEREAIARARLAEGCAELLAHLGTLGIPTAILTRNMREVVETFARTFGFAFQATFTREDGPPKPSPAGVISICGRIGAAAPPAPGRGGYKDHNPGRPRG